MATDDHLIDKRIVKRSLASGKVEQYELDELLANLPDVSANILGPEGSEDDVPSEESADDATASEQAPDSPAQQPEGG